MGFSDAILTRWLLIAGMALAMASSALAQHPGRRPGQAIVFSSTDDEGVSSNTLSLAPKPPGLLDFSSAIQSPDSKPGAMSGADLPPVPPPAISPAQAQHLQRVIDERKNWTLMTPEQILNLPTAEKIFNIPDRDAFGQPKNETVVAQYYARQDQLRVRTNSDNYGAMVSAPHRGLLESRDLQMDPNIWAPAGGRPGNPTMLDQFLKGTTDNHAAAAQAQNKGWSPSSILSAPAPDPTAEQRAAIEQFQPHALSGSTAKSPAPGSPFSSSSSFSANPAPVPSAVISAGESYAPLSSGIAVPVRLTPLPGILGPTNLGLQMFEPESKLQAPPWESSAPKLGAVPQRKF